MSAIRNSPTYVAYRYQQSMSHYLTTLLAKIPAFSSCMRQKAYYRDLKCIFENLLPCYCYATKANSRTRSGFSELQAHDCMLPKQWTWLLCTV